MTGHDYKSQNITWNKAINNNKAVNEPRALV